MTYVVCWMTRGDDRGITTDHYERIEEKPTAEARFDQLRRKRDVATVDLAEVLKTTD